MTLRTLPQISCIASDVLKLCLTTLFAICYVQEEEHDDEGAAFGRMLATHDQNVQNRAQPLDDPEDSFAGKCTCMHGLMMGCCVQLLHMLVHVVTWKHCLHSLYCRYG